MSEFNVLTIDADYWFPSDYQGRHCGFCPRLRGQNSSRRVERLLLDSPRVVPTHEEIVLLVNPNTPIVVTECHADVYTLLQDVRHTLNRRKNSRVSIRVVCLDEHDDDEYGNPDMALFCGNWISHAKDNRFKWQYLDSLCLVWSEDAWTASKNAGLIQPPDLVHVCRSAPYLSTRGDKPFADLVVKLEEKTGHEAVIKGIGHGVITRMVRAARRRREGL